MHRILIKNGLIIPMDGQNRVIKKKALLIEDNQIAAINLEETLIKEYKIDQTIDAGGQVVMPGFVNAHTHIGWSSLCRGISEDISMEDYVFKLAIPLQEYVLTEEDIHSFSRLSCLEMLKCGNTCINELGVFMDGTAMAIEESGIRGMLGQDITDIDWQSFNKTLTTNYDSKLKDQKIKEAIRIYDTWHGKANGRITCRFANDIPMFCSPQALAETKALAKERGIGVNVHANSEKTEIEYFKNTYQKSLIEYLADTGYLDENTNLIHMIHTADNEIDIVKDAGAHIIHCPLNLGKTADCAPLGKFYAAEVNMALGTDWVMNDPFEQMRFAIVLARVNSGNALLRKAYDFLEMFTIKAAKALGLDDKTGSLEIGKRADLILVDMNQPHIIPMNQHYDPVTNLVYNAHGSDVTTVIVDGMILVENGKATTLDEKKVMEEVNIRSNKVLNQLKNL